MQTVVKRSLMTPALPSGTLIDGRYELRGLLGVGGFSKVYRARHIHMERQVALKLLDLQLPESHAEVITKRFEREAQVLGQLDHAQIVSIYDSGLHGLDEQHYMAMSLLDGEPLDRVLMLNGAMDAARVVRLLLPCLEALAHAHDEGIIHKDLKPANLVLERPGQDDEGLMVLDFGAVTLAAMPDGRLTHNGEMIGTPQYLAPEYIRQHTVSPALDVYQMGLILLEMLTGKAALEGQNAYMCMLLHTRGAIDVPPVLAESVLGPIIEQALASDPTERYADARQMLQALEAVDAQALEAMAVFEPVQWELSMPKPTRDLKAPSVGVMSSSAAFVSDGAPWVEKSSALSSVPAAPTESFVSVPTALVERPGPVEGFWASLSLAAVALLCVGMVTVAIGASLWSDHHEGRASAAAVQAPERLRLLERHTPKEPSRPNPALQALEIRQITTSAHVSGRGPQWLTDGNPSTSWKPRGRGVGQLRIELERPAAVHGLILVTGWDMELERGAKEKMVTVRTGSGQVRRVKLDGQPGVARVSFDPPLKTRTMRLSISNPRSIGEIEVVGQKPIRR